jgi:hypothetical protein
MKAETKREFLELVVAQKTTECWLWAGAHDEESGRLTFAGEAAYRHAYRIHYGGIPSGHDVHHTCENSGCVNPRHLIALSPEAHRAVHAALRVGNSKLVQAIYDGQWRQLEAERLAAEQEKTRLQQENERELERLRQAQIEREQLEVERRERLRAERQEADRIVRQLVTAPFVIHNSYFGRERFEGVEERNGLQMHFAGWLQPLENYMFALEAARFAVSALRKPIPDGSEAWDHMERRSRIPLFLWLKARPLPSLGVPFRRGNS